MANETVKDFLGHPCCTTVAFEHYDELIDEARRTTAEDVRLVAQQVGSDFMKVHDRIGHLCALIDAMAKHMPDDTEDELRAMIAAGSEYAIATSNRFGKLAGMSLLALEKGGLWAPAKEVQHG